MTIEKKVKDFMKKEILSIGDQETLSKAFKKMHENKVKALLVFDNKGNFKGVITEEVITKSYLNPETTKVKSLTLSAPKSIQTNMDIYKAAYLFFNSHLPLVPVFEEETIVGVLEIKDFIYKYVKEDKEFGSKPAIDIATTEVISIYEYDTIGNALRIMRDNKITRLPVLGKNGKPIGLLSLHDIIKKLIKPRYKSEKSKAFVQVGGEKIKITEYPVKEIMNDVLHVLDPLSTIEEVIKTMIDLGISSIVLLEDEEIKGIITDKDILERIASNHKKEEKIKISYSIAGDVKNLDKTELEDAIIHIKSALEKYESYLNEGILHIYIKQHEEKFRSKELYHIRMRLSSSKGTFVVAGENWGLYNAIGITWKKLREQIEYKKEIEKDPYLGLRKLVKEVVDSRILPFPRGED